jgi:hypothetical protein
MGYNNKTIKEVKTAKFLGLQIDSLNWNKRVEYVIPKPRSACFIMRTVTPLIKIYTCTSTLFYFAYFHSIMPHGVVFWGETRNSVRVFNIQKKIVRIMAVVKKSLL